MDLEMLQMLYANAGWYGIAAALVTSMVRLFRHPDLQESLAPRFRWVSMPLGVRLLIILLASVATSLVASIGAGVTGWAALAAAVPTAIAAILGHKTTKLVGHTAQELAQRKKARYRPGSIRTVLDEVGVLPLNHKKLEKL